ncbi:MAG: cysteine--tRNA ligase [Alicyclobacillus herbarius]|uniref:cysteine--tRNA ligase n=1 Tax=Alicyclobacillus herbarius TaxID=122960 RepID=UPI00040C883F|nr:cysteine--tRNA ligase [Alicyclobacillus herbarius]MCL6632896.1 cysteine--tRNA ligase [Alicyclobacillus herbarius]
MAIWLYNSLTRTKERLETLEPGKVRFYACGPTVYNLFHIGNARMFVVFDMIRRYLEYRGYEVRYVQNFTDVDDRIIGRANELGIGVREVADTYIQAYFEDADRLGIRRANVHPRVTECIPEIIRFIEDLIANGHAYVVGGDVYFDTSSFPEYGKLSHQSIDEMQAGFRIEVNEQKRNPADFALWKAAKPHEEFWQSPWGPGRPGWHIECSVMNFIYLGEQIDIHAGGRDLIFPHHENEIAQSEAHNHKPFARYWLHNGTLNINGEKMSKSTGNFIMTRDLLEKRPALAIRFFLLSAQYRHPLNYTEEAMDQAEQALDRIRRCLRNLDHREQGLAELPQYLAANLPDDEDEVAGAADAVRSQFIQAMDDDFNSADGIAAIFEGVREANLYLEKDLVSAAGIRRWRAVLLELLDVLGLRPEETPDLLEADIAALLEERREARARRDFARADAIRDELAAQGIVIEDTPQGTRWYRQ